MRGENRQKGEIKHRKKYTKQKNTSFEWNQMQRYEFLMPFGLRQTKIHAKKTHFKYRRICRSLFFIHSTVEDVY